MGGWLAGLDAFIVGVAYLGALLASRFVLRPLLVSVLGGAPVVGGWLSSNVASGLSSFERTITPAANASMGTIVSALDWLVTQSRAVLNGTSALAEATYAGLYHLGAESLHQAVGASVQYVEGLVASARGFALAQVQAAEARLGGELAAVEVRGGALVEQARSEALAEVSAAEAVALGEIRKVEQTTGQLFQQAEYDAGQLAAAAEVKSAELVAAARADLQAEVAAVERELGQLGRVVGVEVASVSQTLGGDLSAAEARLAAALAGVESGLGATIDQVIKSGPWGALVAAYEGGEAALAADVETLVRLSLAEVRQQIAEAGAIRAKYGPAVMAEIARLGRAV